jgi:hypothetical protein
MDMTLEQYPALQVANSVIKRIAYCRIVLYNTDDCQAAQYLAIYETHSCPNLPTLSYLHFFRLAAASSLYLARGAYSLFSSNPINDYNVPSDRFDRAVAPHVQYYTPNVDGV